MKRGLFFKIPQNTTKTLWDILSCIDVEQFCWHYIATQSEIWDAPFGNDFFEKEFYSGKAFRQHIQHDHFAVFLKMEAYIEGAAVADNIRSYEDFLKSGCQLIFLLYDCEYVEIYTKSEPILMSLYANANTSGFQSINFITDSNDHRTKMEIL